MLKSMCKQYNYQIEQAKNLCMQRDRFVLEASTEISSKLLSLNVRFQAR